MRNRGIESIKPIESNVWIDLTNRRTFKIESIDPIGPIESIDPIGPIESIESIESIDSIGSIESIDPIESIQSIQSIDSIEQSLYLPPVTR